MAIYPYMVWFCFRFLATIAAWHLLLFNVIYVERPIKKFRINLNPLGIIQILFIMSISHSLFPSQSNLLRTNVSFWKQIRAQNKKQHQMIAQQKLYIDKWSDRVLSSCCCVLIWQSNIRSHISKTLHDIFFKIKLDWKWNHTHTHTHMHSCRIFVQFNWKTFYWCGKKAANPL